MVRANEVLFLIQPLEYGGELADKVLIPILGDQYGEVLERQELQLTYRDGAFVVRYYEESLPIAPERPWIVARPSSVIAKLVIT